MVLTESTMMKLGTIAPDFELINVDQKSVSKKDFEGKPLLVMFICNHCPYVKHITAELARLGNDYQDRVGIVAISSNDAEAYPDDSPEKMVDEVSKQGYTFPYLHDGDQQVGLAYTAACTPDFFLFDEKHALVYRGRLDGTKPNRIRSGVYESDHPSDGAELRAALDAVLAGAPLAEKQYPSLGCNIKWKPGNEPY